MALQPWYKVTIPREDLRDGKPMDASECGTHPRRACGHGAGYHGGRLEPENDL